MAANFVTKRQHIEADVIAATTKVVDGLLELNAAWAELVANGFNANTNKYVDADFTAPYEYIAATNFDDIGSFVTNRLGPFITGAGAPLAGDFAKLAAVKLA